MAFYVEDEEQQNPEGEQSFTPGGQSSQLGGVGGSSVASGGAATAKSTPDNPGNFVGLKQYLDANQRQSEKLGSDVAGRVSGAIGQAKSNIENLGTDFRTKAESGLISNFEGAGQEAQGIVNQAATAPKANLPGQNQVQRFGDIANAQYKGPKDVTEIETFNPTLQSVTEAQRLSSLAGTEEGKEGLVKDVANPQSKYSQGQARLDSYLLGTQSNKQKLEQARQGYEQIEPLFQQQKEQAQNLVKDLEQKNADLRTQARSLLEGTALNKKTSVESDLSKIQKQIADNNKKAQEYRNLFADTGDKGSLTLTPQQMSELGIQAGSIDRLYGALNQSPNQFIDYNQVFDPNAAISLDEQARLSALADLSGTYGGGFTNPYAASQVAGTLNPQDPFANVGRKLAEEVARREAIYNQANTNYDWVNPVLTWTPEQYKGFADAAKTSEEYENFLKSGRSGFTEAGVNILLDRLSKWRDKYGANDRLRINDSTVELPNPVLGGI